MPLIARALRAAVAAALPIPLPGVNPAASDDLSTVATPRLAFVNGRLCQWHASTAGDGGEWREVPSIEIESEESPVVVMSTPDANGNVA